MYDYQRIHRTALKNGLRFEGQATGDSLLLFTHLEAKDGSRYEFTHPITDEQLAEAQGCQNCLFVKTPTNPDDSAADFNIFATARVVDYYSKDARRWVQTQNAIYKLI